MSNLYAGYSSNLIAFDGFNANSWIVNKSHEQVKYDYIFQGASAGCTYVLNSEAFKIICDSISSANFDQLKKISHDWLIYAIVRSSKMKWINDKSAYIFYRQHSSNNYGDKRGISLILNRYRLLKMGWYKSQINFISNHITQNEDVREVKMKILEADIINRLSNLNLLLKSRRKISESLFVIFLVIIGLI
jgi:rhamnosyltransferase